MHGVASEKVKGGKLVRVKLEHDEGSVRSVQITGDFFLHPEDALEQMEETLIGLNPLDTETAAKRLHAVIASRDAVLVGVAPEDIARLVAAAAGAGK
jgi:lipoate-protein ligase A